MNVRKKRAARAGLKVFAIFVKGKEREESLWLNWITMR